MPPEIRDRTPAPHALRVGLRRPELPSGWELAAFCDSARPAEESGVAWIRLIWPPDRLLVLLEEVSGPMGFDHSLLVESTRSKTCFLAAYFIARRCGGVIQARKRAALPAAAFSERYLEGEDLDSRWTRATEPS